MGYNNTCSVLDLTHVDNQTIDHAIYSVFIKQYNGVVVQLK